MHIHAAINPTLIYSASLAGCQSSLTSRFLVTLILTLHTSQTMQGANCSTHNIDTTLTLVKQVWPPYFIPTSTICPLQISQGLPAHSWLPYPLPALVMGIPIGTHEFCAVTLFRNACIIIYPSRS